MLDRTIVVSPCASLENDGRFGFLLNARLPSWLIAVETTNPKSEAPNEPAANVAPNIATPVVAIYEPAAAAMSGTAGGIS